MSAFSTFKARKHGQHPPPVFQLHHDLLWHIFSWNADMAHESDEIPALDTLRATSQVCFAWRELAIRSPSLWGRVLNLPLLAREEWRSEVIIRTGTSGLHIKSGGYALPDGMMGFIEWLLNEHWTRIRSLKLRFNVGFHLGPVDDDKWRIFQRPAVLLESFIISRYSTEPEYFSAPDFVLFGNEAPSLLTLSLTNVKVDMKASWVSNLRCLELHSPSDSPILASDLLHALANAPLLESLRVSSVTMVDEKTKSAFPLLQVVLPRLTEIVFFSDQEIDVSLTVLGLIIPANGCRLTLEVYYSYSDLPSDQSIAAAHTVLSTYSHYCTELMASTILRLSIAKDEFEFEAPLSSHGHFRFYMDMSDNIDLSEYAISTLLISFPTFQFNNLRKLTLSLKLPQSSISNPMITQFILALVSVDVLQFHSHEPWTTLQFINMIQSSVGVVVLPALKVINLLYGLDDVNLGYIEDFLESRITLEVPLDMLTLTMSTSRSFSESTRFASLKKFTGLTLQLVES